MKRILISAAAAVMLVCGIAGPPAVAAESEPPVTWSIEPTDAEGERDGRTSIRHEVDPGDRVDDAVTVTNYSTKTATFLVYAADGLTGSGGNFDIAPPGVESTDSGTWVSVAGQESVELELEPEESATVELTIAVPEDATPGDHPAGVVAEFVPADADQVTVASRIGVRLHLRVSGEITAGVTIDDLQTRWEPSWNPFAPGTMVVEYSLSNSGNVRVGAGSEVTVSGPWGLAPLAGSQEVREILPSSQTRQRFELDVWPLVFVSGEVSAVPVAVGDDAVAAEMLSARAAVQTWAIPWAQLVLVLVVGGAVLLVRALRIRSRRRVAAQIEAAVAQARAEQSPADGGS